MAPSKIANAGVGVFALTFIPKNTVIFQTQKNQFIQWIELIDMEKEVIAHIKSICNHDKYGFWIDCEINKITPAYYVNHSDDPNLYHDLSKDQYFSIRNIEIGEELTCKYLPEEIDWV
jgi:SET domain-containing protein